MKSRTVEVQVKWPGREEAELRLELNDKNEILKAELRGIGGPDLLDMLISCRRTLNGSLSLLPLPEGHSSAALCLREVILKAKGEWDFPYKEQELCHCRAVPTEVVDQAICAGAHTPQKVSAETSASTACGTCRPDVEAILAYRLRSR